MAEITIMNVVYLGRFRQTVGATHEVVYCPIYYSYTRGVTFSYNGTVYDLGFDEDYIAISVGREVIDVIKEMSEMTNGKAKLMKGSKLEQVQHVKSMEQA